MLDVCVDTTTDRRGKVAIGVIPEKVYDVNAVYLWFFQYFHIAVYSDVAPMLNKHQGRSLSGC